MAAAVHMRACADRPACPSRPSAQRRAPVHTGFVDQRGAEQQAARKKSRRRGLFERHTPPPCEANVLRFASSIFARELTWPNRPELVRGGTNNKKPYQEIKKPTILLTEFHLEINNFLLLLRQLFTHAIA